jgi:5'-nucleotidase
MIASDQRVSLNRHELAGPAAGIEAYSIDGPPGLAALLACRGALGEVPDLIVSGINGGPNTGHAILHSGTVGAALTGASFRVSALAGSLDGASPMPWGTVRVVLPEVIDVVTSVPPAVVLNVNVPAVPASELREIRWATLDRFGTVRVAVAERVESELQLEYRSTGWDLDPSSDTALLAAGFATMTAIEGIAAIPPPLAAAEPKPAPDARLVERLG